MPFGFTYNGIHSSDMGIRVVTDVRRSILPPITARTITVPGRPGAYYQGHDYGMRAIEVDIVLDEASLSDLRTRVRQLAGWLQPGDDPRELVFDDEPEIAWKAVLSGDTDIEEIVATGRGTLTFLCPDPHAYAVAEKRRTIAAVSASFSRSSVAYKSDGTQVAADMPRFETVNGRTGVLVEETTTNQVYVVGWVSWFAALNIGGFSDQNTGGGTIRITRLGTYRYKAEVISDVVSPIVQLTPNFTWPANQKHTISAVIVDYYEAPGTEGRIGLGRSSWGGPHLNGYSGTGLKTWTYSDPEDRPAGLAIRADTGKVIKAGSYIVWEFAQIELNRPYATTFVDGTRAAETLTVPTAGILQPQAGTIEFWAYVDAQVRDTSRIRRFFSHFNGAGNANRITIQHSNDPIWLFSIANDSGSVHSLSVPDTYTPDGWHYFAMVWDSTRFAVYIDGVKRGEVLNPTHLPQSLAPTFDIGHHQGSNQPNTLIGPLRISRRARTDQEIADAYAAGTLMADEDTTALYKFDGTLTPENNQTITNDGTAAAYPVIRAYVQRPTTFLAVATADRQILLGKPDIVESAPVERETRILYDQLTTTTGWGPGVQVDGGVVTGSFYSDGQDLRVSSYGTGSLWHGPALKKSLPELLTDFRVTVWLSFYNRSKKVGRMEVYLLDPNNAVLAKLALKDNHPTVDDVWGEARVGPWGPGVYFVNTHGLKAGVWNDYHGVMQIERVGNVWRAFFGKYDYSKRQFHTRWSAQYVDVNNQYGAQLAAIQLHAGAYGSYTPCDAWFNAVIVDKINNVQATEVPYIAVAGDEIEIDCERAVIRKNGMVDLSLLDVASRFPRLEPKTGTTFGVAPEDAAIVEITFRERWL